MKVTRHRKARSLRHKIHMPEGIWTYQIGRGGATIRNPDCELTAKINMSELTGWSWPALERAEYKGGWPEVKPSDIRSRIDEIKNGIHEVVITSTPKKKAHGLISIKRGRVGTR